MNSLKNKFTNASPEKLKKAGWYLLSSSDTGGRIYARGKERLLFREVDPNKLKFVSYLKLTGNRNE